MYCTDLLGLTEAKQIVEGDEFENVLGVDDGKSLFKVCNHTLKKFLCKFEFV